ncbi:glycogen debranching N-terminal domain-containing protein [Phycicoccus sp. 3266]|uniref:glycogen debranching N-terminal domain-containing protein n=1 Tax=Phycicoccus sp. 3266 TaxID=2817751 RepID=UPI0028673062|nr:glycogen debranching N-terminal domain-containing protein [Phycicoccus sp. 3266]MDR6864626.1 glycogen debranching enzyme [Phycicoccus sp. 3266]
MPTRHRQPWLHDLAITVRGNVTALSGEDGQLLPGTAHGLYVDDERVLSGLRVTVGGDEPSLVAGEARAGRAQFLSSARDLGNPGADPTVEVRRSRELVEAGLVETIRVVSRAATTVSSVLRVELEADGADMATVKAGQVDQPPLAPSVDGARVLLEAPRHRVTVEAGASPRVEAGAAVYEHPFDLPPGDSLELVVRVGTTRRTESALDADPGLDAVTWDDVVVEADDPRLAPLVAESMADLRHLLLRDPLDRADVFAAAGTPWYLTLFGRDSIWAARLMLPFGTELAAGTLRSLARRQGTKDDPDSAEQPGKIAHEVRRTAYGAAGHALQLPPLYYGTVDATALWVCLLVDAWRWGLPEDEVRALLPNLDAALDWLTGPGRPDTDGLLKYIDTTGHGLANQGWKDSGDSMRMRDGRIADAPIALVEAQAYAVEALAGAADLLEALGADDAGRWAGQAQDVAARVRDRFWVEDDQGRYLAMALDGSGAPVDGVGSNMGHVLGTGAVTADEAALVAQRLTSPGLLDRFGVRTMSTDTGGFNPIGYHTGSIWTHDTAIAAVGLSREGFGDLAGTLAQALVGSGTAFDRRWPELYSGLPVIESPAPYPASCRPQAWSAASVGALVTTALGLRADVPNGELVVRPPATPPFGSLRVRGLRWGATSFSVVVDRDGGVHVEGLPDSVSVVVTA